MLVTLLILLILETFEEDHSVEWEMLAEKSLRAIKKDVSEERIKEIQSKIQSSFQQTKMET